MNSFLKLAVSKFPGDWESPYFGTIIRPRLSLIDKAGNIEKPWESWKYKQYCLPTPLPLEPNDFRGPPQGGPEVCSQLARAQWKEYNAETYHRLDRKVLLMYTDMRVFLKNYLTEAQFRREKGTQTLFNFIRYLYLEQVQRELNDFKDGDYANGSKFHLELDLRREPRDRLAIVSNTQELLNGSEK